MQAQAANRAPPPAPYRSGLASKPWARARRRAARGEARRGSARRRPCSRGSGGTPSARAPAERRPRTRDKCSVRSLLDRCLSCWQQDPASDPTIARDGQVPQDIPSSVRYARADALPAAALFAVFGAVLALALALARRRGGDRHAQREADHARDRQPGPRDGHLLARRGRMWHVFYSGAINARPPSRTLPQVKFKVDYSGGRGKWRRFKNTCRALRRPGARVVRRTRARRATARTGRCRAGSGCCRTSATSRGSTSRRSGSCTSPTGRASSRSSRCTRTGSTAAASTRSSAARPTAASRSTASRRRTRASRSTRTAGWSSSTRSAPRTGRAGGARTRSSSTTRAGCSATASIRTLVRELSDAAHAEARGQRREVPLTLSGPGVTPDVAWTGDGLAEYDARDPGCWSSWEEQMARRSARWPPVRRAAVRPPLSRRGRLV